MTNLFARLIAKKDTDKAISLMPILTALSVFFLSSFLVLQLLLFHLVLFPRLENVPPPPAEHSLHQHTQHLKQSHEHNRKCVFIFATLLV